MPCSRFLGRVRGVFAVCLVSASLAWAQGDELQGPPPNHREVAKIISTIVPKQHLLRQPLDDKVSERALQEFLKMLDPLKAYFDQADIDEFQRQKLSIDDAVVRGDLTFAYTIFNRFLQRVEQRVATVQQLLASDLDFDREESLTIERDKLAYPRNEQEAVQPLAQADQVRPADARERGEGSRQTVGAPGASLCQLLEADEANRFR